MQRDPKQVPVKLGCLKGVCLRIRPAEDYAAWNHLKSGEFFVAGLVQPGRGQRQGPEAMGQGND